MPFTAYLMKHDSPVKLQGSVLYHCGPVVLKDNGHYRITAAGPTTSIREEPYQAEIIERFGIRAVMGKGGMGARTLAGLKASGAVYLNAIGGAAQYYSRCIEEVLGVHLLEFGIPEAMWHIRVRDLPAIVTMDSHGNSLHADVHNASAVLLSRLAEPVFFLTTRPPCRGRPGGSAFQVELLQAGSGQTILMAAGRPCGAAGASGSNSAVECQLPKLDVTGSIPVSRSTFINKLQATRKPSCFRLSLSRLLQPRVQPIHRPFSPFQPHAEQRVRIPCALGPKKRQHGVTTFCNRPLLIPYCLAGR